MRTWFIKMRLSKPWLIRTIAAGIIVGWSGLASAEPTVSEILKQYDSPNANDGQRLAIAKNLESIEVGLGWANTALRAQRMQGGLYCPTSSTVSPARLIEILRSTLKEEPRLGDRPVGFVMLAALQRSYPCK